MGKISDILSFVCLIIGGLLLHTGDPSGLAFVAFGTVQALYFIPVIPMTMKEFFHGKVSA